MSTSQSTLIAPKEARPWSERMQGPMAVHQAIHRHASAAMAHVKIDAAREP
ncbi:hypothetical protein BIFGAL_03913 [Bifidobacterium gallicum DSM 20093 = LMG 11596]|uniref:Uncharacterized protein n=1 Tax=Bifidobacterium gallicum DSM 20093 = LMG 11596 TaxID=561180 RepID=D1NVM3_9BIFI|nr:hypothetical protein BIFGAL_03913 [Bifidobacterium gallicum DSM 20093 = LMG 11596]